MIKPRTIVKNKKTKIKGVVIEDSYGICGLSTALVIYENTNWPVETDVKNLKVIGLENAKADFKKCGRGKGKEACIFLFFDGKRFECQRFGPMRDAILALKKKMTAKREPLELYPNCQLK